MQIFRKLAAFCTAFFFAFSLGVAHAASPEKAAAQTTPTPLKENVTSSKEEILNTILPDGTGTVVHIFTDETGKKFYTIQTPAGNTFYLIIDFTKEAENVYFLDAVREKDLLALAEQTGESVEVTVTPDKNDNVTYEPSSATEQVEAAEKNNGNMFSMIMVIIVVLAGIGAGIYFKIFRKRKESAITNLAEYEPEENYEENIKQEANDEEYISESEDNQSWDDNDI